MTEREGRDALKSETGKPGGEFQRIPDPSPPTPRSVAYVSDRSASKGPEISSPKVSPLRAVVLNAAHEEVRKLHPGWTCPVCEEPTA